MGLWESILAIAAIVALFGVSEALGDIAEAIEEQSAAHERVADAVNDLAGTLAEDQA